MFDWHAALRSWSDAIIASGEYDDVLSPDALESRWAGFPPATDEAIAETERRLNLQLPPSYREFLKVSNGWWLDGTDGPIRLWGVEELRLLADSDPETVAIWSDADGLVEDESDPTDLPKAHYASVVQISEDNDGRYLLNPLMPTADGECQVAFFAFWVPGADCHESFEWLMEEKFEEFIAAHPAPSERCPSAVNLAKPPEDPIDDCEQFIAELERLGFFELVSDEIKADMIRDFRDVSRAFAENGMVPVDGPFGSPGSVLCDPRSGRVVNLDTTRLASERGAYAVAAVRPLLASIGIELGSVRESTAENTYSVALEDVERTYFRLRDGRPQISGGEHECNAAGAVLNETGTLINKVLSHKQSTARLATLIEVPSMLSDETRLAFVLLDEDLSYLLMWSQAIHNFCRPHRPDV